MPDKRSSTATPSPLSRSRVSNGKALFVDGDGRGPWARRFRDLVGSHASDLGGLDNLTEAQKSLIRRAATLSVELERMEGDLSSSKPVDLDLYARVAGHLRRILETIGLDRKAKDLTPTLKEYVAKHHGGGQ